jgi:single-strand DNA-binding protein
MNNVSLIGRLVRDIELKSTPNGTLVTSFTVAVDRITAKDAERQTDFINIVAWQKTAEFCSKYFTKGTRIGLTGRIQVRSYDNKDGKRVYVTEVVAEHVYVADGKTTESPPPNDNAPKQQYPATVASNSCGGSNTDFQPYDDGDDGDLPF